MITRGRIGQVDGQSEQLADGSVFPQGGGDAACKRACNFWTCDPSIDLRVCLHLHLHLLKIPSLRVKQLHQLYSMLLLLLATGMECFWNKVPCLPAGLAQVFGRSFLPALIV